MTEPDLLHGYQAIADHLGLSRRQAEHMAANGLPTFKVGRTVCARRSALARYFAEQEGRGDVG
jgi:hypothetical protein